jgi:predicted porin
MSGARIDREDRMKKLLLGTTALVAAGAFAVAAQADEMMAEPVSVGVGGYTTGAIGIASDTDDDTRGQEITYVYEIGVSGSTTLDNGITVAVSGQIGRSAGSDEGMDEIHTTLSGSFGSIRLGRTESAAFNSTVAAPGAGIGGMLGVNYSWFSTAASAVNTYSGLGAEDALKVVYTSPNFNGLSIGMSYAPESDDANFPGRSTDGLGDLTAVGVNYSTDFMEGGSLSLGAGMELASASEGMDPEAMRFGVNVSVDQLSFGGSMFDDENTDSAGMAFDVGASWTEGATEIGVQYAADEDSGDGVETTKTALHLTYTLGPGVLIGGQIAAGSSSGAEDVTQFMLGTAVFF